MTPVPHLRAAQLGDVEKIRDLIRISAHALSRGYYSEDQVEGALMGVFGVDTQLIKDQTYFVIEQQRQMVACGGWSYRATLFGNDDLAHRDPRRLDPQSEAAKIRAFFVHPDHARRGLGKRMLFHCEDCARAAGFSKAELGATLPGKQLYQKFGYHPQAQTEHLMENGLYLEVIPMTKTL